MKIIHKICSLAFVVGIMVCVGCDEMNSLHQKYLDEGEKIHAAQIDSSLIRSGYKRQRLDLFFMAQRIERGKITWNFERDSLEIDFPAPGLAPFSVVIPDLSEGDYTYKLTTYDKFGNPSIPLEMVGKVYGENYQNGLVNKRIESMTTEHDGSEVVTILKWRRAENAVGVKMTYANREGKEVTVFIPEKEEETILTDNVIGGKFSYSTLFLPDTACIDTIAASIKTMDFPAFKRSYFAE